MSQTRLVFRILAAGLIVVGLAVAGFMLYQAGQSNGYAQALAQSEGASDFDQVVPSPMFHPRTLYFPHRLFFPFVGLIKFMVWGLLFFGVFGLLFNRRYWRHHPGMHGCHPSWWKESQGGPDQGKATDQATEK